MGRADSFTGYIKANTVLVLTQGESYFLQLRNHLIGEWANLNYIYIGAEFSGRPDVILRLALNGEATKGVHDVAVGVIAEVRCEVEFPIDIVCHEPNPLGPLSGAGTRAI